MMSITKILSFGSRPIFAKGQERNFQYLLAFLWGYNLIVSYFIAFIKNFTMFAVLDDLIVPLTIILLVLFSARYIISVNSKWTWLIFFFLCILLLASSAFGNPVQAQGFESFGLQVAVAVPYILVGSGLDYRRDFTLLTIISWLNIVGAIFYQFYYLSSGREVDDDMMALAYYLLPNVIICFLSAFQRNLLISWIVGICGTLMLFVAGTRGAVVAVAVFFLLYLFLYTLPHGRNKIRTIMLIIIIGLIIITYFTAFFDYTSNLGFGTRIYDQLTGNVEMTGSGRERMHAVSIQEIMNQGFFGHGVFGEQYLYRNIVGKYTYPHNLVLELMLQFGLFIGGILVIMVFYLPIKAYKIEIKNRNYRTAMFIVALATSVYMNLLFSYTFWTTPLFFFVLSYFIRLISQKDKQEPFLLRSSHVIGKQCVVGN